MQSVANRKMLVISSSRAHGSKYLEFAKESLIEAFKGKKYLLFVPFARAGGRTHDEYTNLVRDGLKDIGIDFPVKGIHEFEDYQQAIKDAEVLFTGGGNTFLLLTQLYKNNLLTILKEQVNSGKLFYIGASAGSNITGISVQNTNDMPIIHPPSFESLNILNFNINPHYLDPDTNSTHKGETREERINEFHVLNNIPVFGIREGSWLSVEGEKITLQGKYNGRLFEQNKAPVEIETGSDVSFINQILGSSIDQSKKLATAGNY